MVNYLPICLSSSARTWLKGLPTGSVRSWSDLGRQFVSNFRATYEQPSTQGRQRRTRSQVTQIDRGFRSPMTRRGSMTTPLPTWNDRIVTGLSTGPGQVSTRVSWMESVFSTLKKSTRLGTPTSCMASPMKSSNQPRRSSKRRKQKTRRVTSPRLARRSTTSSAVPTPLSLRGSRSSRPGRSWQLAPLHPST
jgi:hypothetical protein